MRKTLLIGWLWLLALTLSAQPICRVVKYNEADGVPSSHVTQLLQDERGFMWFSTWNGLCRFDGYEFQTFKPQVGDGCHMPSDRIRNIYLLPGGLILCQVDEEHYMFDLKSYRFRDLTDAERQQVETYTQQQRQSRSLQNRKNLTWTDSYQTVWAIDGQGRLTYRTTDDQEVDYPLDQPFKTLTFAMADHRGNLWALDHGNIYQFCTDRQRSQRVAIEPRAEVKCLFDDHAGHYWVTTKDDETVRLYHTSDNSLIGYLGTDGRIHPGYTRFGAAVYGMLQTTDGALWLATKPQGLFRLRPTGDLTFHIDSFTDLPGKAVYHLLQDRYGRLWAASLDGGVFVTTQPGSEHPHFVTPRQYPLEQARRARYLFLTEDDVLLVATSNGLLTARLRPQADDMRFQQHLREPDRQNSLSSSATMDIVQDRQGHYFVSTESGGVNLIEDTDLLAPTLTFRHLSEQYHVRQSHDIVQSMTATTDGGLMVVGSHLITLTDSTLQGRVFDVLNDHADYRFSEAHPLRLSNGQWLFGLMDGAVRMTTGDIGRQAYTPRLVLTHMDVRGEMSEAREVWGAEGLDTLVLQPHERSLTVHFAALDYAGAERISYAFRLSGSDDWNYVGHNRSATLLDLKPATYVLEIRSTNADGEWQDNIRPLTIIVKPTFWEAWYGQLLIVLLILGVLVAIAYTLLYIRRIRRQHRETLEKYLALIGARSEERGMRSVERGVRSEECEAGSEEPESQKLDPMLQRVMQFVEENIGNSDAGVGEMAQAAATSRSGLQRKLKQAMGITPQDLMKEARIKHASHLLRDTDKTVSEVAYACGFTDPKYFSKCFKQITGMSPSEMRSVE